jgi:hypothetical protein
VYNLVWSGPPAAAPRPRRDPAASQLRAAARAWAASGDSGQRLALPLEHVYTSANLGFDQLKVCCCRNDELCLSLLLLMQLLVCGEY